MAEPKIVDTVLSLFSPSGLSTVMIFFILILEVIYVFYAFIIVRQIDLLNDTFKTEAGWLFRLFSFLHLFLAIGLVLISVLSL